MQTILVGLDGSPRSSLLVERAATMARQMGATLVLFRAIGLPVELPPDAWSIPPSELVTKLERDAQVYLEQLGSTLPAEVVWRAVVHIGTPWQAVCQAAKECSADLVMIGSHGYDTLDRLLGTTAAKVVNHAETSVLVVRK